MRLFVLATCLLLTACAATPAQIVVTSGPVDYLAAGEIVRAATGTAIWQATANAQATAARGATLQALEGQQTQAALQMTTDAGRLALQATQGAGQALATDGAAIKTQAAGQTAAWGTPTAAALGTQLAFSQVERSGQATQIAANAARAAASADAVGYVAQALGIAALLGALTIAAIAAVYYQQRRQADLEAYQEIQRQRVERERAETQRALAEAIKASTIDFGGQPHLITARGYVPLLPAAALAVPQPNRAMHWRWYAAIRKAVQAGLVLGERAGTGPQFGERDLASREQPWIVNPDGTPSSAGYRKINRALRALEIWVTAGRDTTWAPGWGAERFEREFDTLPLPAWLEGEPPEVRIPDRSSAIAAVPQFRDAQGA